MGGSSIFFISCCLDYFLYKGFLKINEVTESALLESICNLIISETIPNI